MYCNYCGKDLPGDALFCNQCGNKIQPAGQGPGGLPSSGRTTIQFGNSGQLPPTQRASNSNPQLPPTQFAGGSNPQFPPGQFPAGSNPQLPPTQFAGGSNPQFPPLRPSTGPYQDQQSANVTPPFGLPPTQQTRQAPFTRPFGTPLPAPPSTGPQSYLPPTQQTRQAPLTRPFGPGQQSVTGSPPYWQTGPTGPTGPTDPYGAPAPIEPPRPVQPPPPPNAMQHLLIRLFQPQLAGNAFFGIALGGVLAAILGVLASALLLSLAHAITGNIQRGEFAVAGVLNISPLGSSFRDTLQFFLVIHGVTKHYQSATSVSYNDTSVSPLNGLLIIPALLLTLGGYIAACTDFRNQTRSSLLRGAAIAIPYVILLFIMSSQVNGCVPDYRQDISTLTCNSSSPTSISVDGLSLFVLGLLWGVLFGLLGASLKLASGQWRHMIFEYLRSTRRPQIAGMITGGLISIGVGIALSLLVLVSTLAYSTYSVPFMRDRLCNANSWQFMTLWGLVEAPIHAVNLFFFSFGVPVNITNQANKSCFYTSAPHTTLSLFGGISQSGDSIHLSPWFYALLLIPFISLFLGGRASAAIGRARGVGPGAVQGLLIVVPFTILMMLLTAMSTIALTGSYTDQSGQATSFVESFGASAFDVLLWALLFSAVFGALGGMYQTSAVRPTVSRILAALTLPLKLLAKPAFWILDRLTGYPRSAERSSARTIFYAAFLCLILLAIGSGIAGGFILSQSSTIAPDNNYRIRDIASVILIALPGLFVIGAIISALSHDPVPPKKQNTVPQYSGNAPVMPFYQGQRGV